VIDQYRVTLFKKKIKESVAGKIDNVRFRSSRNRQYLFFDHWEYVNKKRAFDVFTSALSRNGISWEPVPGLFGQKEPWCVRIPIDQEALPERKRS